MKVGDLQVTLKDCLATKAFPCVLLQSAPGVGKTESVRYVANTLIHEDNLPYDLLILHPVGRDQSFVGGYPTLIQGRAVHVAYGDLEQLQNATRPTICADRRASRLVRRRRSVTNPHLRADTGRPTSMTGRDPSRA